MLCSFAMAKICLRGGEEHRNLKVYQFERLGDPDRYLYHENCSKNRSGTFRQLHVDSKVVPIYCTCNRETSALDERCHIHLVDLYISKIPEKMRTEQGLFLFYLRPLQLKPLDETSPWFCNVAVGKNTLQSKCVHTLALRAIKLITAYGQLELLNSFMQASLKK